MIYSYYYTDKEMKELIKSMIILVDTREKETHITDFFDKKKIQWKSKKLDHGDYSFYIPANDALGITRDMYFDKEVMIERKGSLEEISGNLTNGRDRFEKELALSPNNKVLLVEDGAFEDIVKSNYDTKYNNKSFLASLFTFWFRYNIPVFFMPNKELSGVFIKMYFEYFLKSKF